MNITFVSRHYELKNPQKSYIEKKLRSIRKRYFDKRLDVQVELRSEKSRQRCELNVRSDRFQERLGSESHDMQQSIVEAIDKLEMMLRKQHDKMVNRKRIEKRDLAGVAEPLTFAGETKGGGADPLPEIVEVQPTSAKPISIPEAATLLQESDDHFISFRDARADDFVVLYKRQDGKLGLIRHSS